MVIARGDAVWGGGTHTHEAGGDETASEPHPTHTPTTHQYTPTCRPMRLTTETTQLLLWSWKTEGRMVYDASLPAERVDRASGRGDR